MRRSQLAREEQPGTPSSDQPRSCTSNVAHPLLITMRLIDHIDRPTTDFVAITQMNSNNKLISKAIILSMKRKTEGSQ